MSMSPVERASVVISRGDTRSRCREKMREIINEYARGDGNPALSEKEINKIEEVFVKVDNGNNLYEYDEILVAEGHLRKYLQIDYLDSTDQNIRNSAIESLGNVGSDGKIDPVAKEAIPKLLQMLKGCKDERLINSISKTIKKIGPAEKKDVPKLIGFLKDRDSIVYLFAAIILGDIGPDATEALPELRKILNSEDATVLDRSYVGKAIQNISAVNGVTAISALIQILNKTEGKDHLKTAKALENMTFSLEDLISLLKDDDWRIRYNTAILIVQIGPAAKDAIGTLIELLFDKKDEVRYMAAIAIGRIGPNGPEAKAAANGLLPMLREKKYESRFLATGILSGLGPNAQDAIPDLLLILNDKRAEIRTAAISALGNIGLAKKGVVPALIKFAESDNNYDLPIAGDAKSGAAFIDRMLTQSSAIKALGNIGADAKEALPTLKAIVNSLRYESSGPAADIRKDAENAIKKIQGKN